MEDERGVGGELIGRLERLEHEHAALQRLAGNLMAWLALNQEALGRAGLELPVLPARVAVDFPGRGTVVEAVTEALAHVEHYPDGEGKPRLGEILHLALAYSRLGVHPGAVLEMLQDAMDIASPEDRALARLIDVAHTAVTG